MPSTGVRVRFPPSVQTFFSLKKVFFSRFHDNDYLNKQQILTTSDDVNNAKVAQLVEHNLAKVGVASSNLVFRSRCLPTRRHLFLKAAMLAEVVELVDTQDLKSCALNRRAGSIPAFSTETKAIRNDGFSFLVMFFTYVLLSEKSGKFYVGHTEDLTARLDRHNNGFVVSTRNKGPWKIVYSENSEPKRKPTGVGWKSNPKKAENILKR